MKMQLTDQLVEIWHFLPVVLLCLPAAIFCVPREAHAITINIEYTDEGDPEPHDENPSWDPAGTILKAHFAAAKTLWESWLPGEGEISFDFHWDDDISGLGQYTPGFDEYIEINPNQMWFADATPNDSAEFDVSNAQTLHSGLTPSLQTFFFPGTQPPAALEVGFRGAGIFNTPSVAGFGSANGADLLSTVVHEIGHALGINGVEPGDYNIRPEHVGGLQDVTVKEGDGGHLAGNGSIPVLMCEACGPIGVRRFATATDILVAAEEMGISNVHLPRVGRISAGSWSNSNAWIGADVPDATQDAYVRQGQSVDLDVSADVKSLVVDGGSSVNVAGFLLAARDMKFAGGSLSVGTGGRISAHNIQGDPGTLTTAAGSTVEFNQFNRGASSATTATFNGNVNIGIGAEPGVVTFNPGNITTWNIGQNLGIGSGRAAKLAINGTWNVGGNLDIYGGLLDSELVVDNGGALNVTGAVTLTGNAALIYRDHQTSNTTYTVRGGGTVIRTPPPPAPRYLEHSPPARLNFENTVRATGATIIAEGGTGDGADGGIVRFTGQSRAVDGEFWTKPGNGGVSLRISNPVVIAGTGGRVIFQDSAFTIDAHFRNDGVNAHGPQGSGGATYFYNSSYAGGSDFDNYGSPMTGYTGAVPAPGGRTEFFDTSFAQVGNFYNHPGQGMGALGAGITIFRESSKATQAKFYNKGAVPGLIYGGSTEFYDSASAEEGEFFNEHSPSLSQNPGTAGNVRFYNSSTAGHATFHNQSGGGTVYFNDSSTADDAHFFIEDTGTGTFGGHVVFQGSSKGGTADFTIRQNCFSSSIEFRGTSDAEHAEFTLVNGSQGTVLVTNGATLNQANLDIGSESRLNVSEFANAGHATVRLRPGGLLNVSGAFNSPQLPTASLANATINIDGGSVFNGGGGSLFVGTWGTTGDATINVGGGTVPGALGGFLSYNNGGVIGNATIIAAAGVAGAGGGRVVISGGISAANNHILIGTGGSLGLNANGGTTIGSIDCAGSIFLGEYEMRVGALNMANTISGAISGNGGNARVTKIGAGTLELTGANTYLGVTRVDGGTLAINGSTAAGGAQVNSGATLKGRGTIGGTVTVNTGGKFAPGNSANGLPSPVTIGGLAMTSGSSLDFELGATSYDRILSSGSLALAGTLNVSLFDSFMPAIGSMFDLLNWGTLSGTFNAVNLPTLAGGLSWDASQLYTTGVIAIASAPGVAGDYNNNGVVDAADYVLWRNGGPLANEPDAPGTVSDGDYAAWRARFGNSNGSGTSTSPVPEPGTCTVVAALLLASPTPLARRRRPTE